jgi:hypothetical protein
MLVDSLVVRSKYPSCKLIPTVIRYVVNDIVFKFAEESKLNLGEDGDEKAAKIAGADLTGLIAHYSCDVPDIYFPMTVLVDFCGFRGFLCFHILPADSLSYCNVKAANIQRSSPRNSNVT